MRQAIDVAAGEVWLATYIFDDDPAARAVAEALQRAAARGVGVHVVVDGFGCIATLGRVRKLFAGSGVQLQVFRPLDRWYAWLQPGQLRRLHQKLCVCDERVAFVGGINIIDDRHDMNHGWTDAPRLDYAVELRGPLVASVHATARAMWARAHLWQRLARRGARDRAQRAAGTRRRCRCCANCAARPQAPEEPEQRRRCAPPSSCATTCASAASSSAATSRPSATRACASTSRCPTSTPESGFRRALRHAARRGVRVRLLLQGKVDYRIAALAAQVLYDELRHAGVRIYEYTPAFLHAKVAVVDDDWATVGSSNIDPLSLLLNLEANVVVRDADFSRALAERFDAAFAVSTEVTETPVRAGWRGWLQRALVAWVAAVYLRVAGITGRY